LKLVNKTAIQGNFFFKKGGLRPTTSSLKFWLTCMTNYYGVRMWSRKQPVLPR